MTSKYKAVNFAPPATNLKQKKHGMKETPAMKANEPYKRTDKNRTNS